MRWRTVKCICYCRDEISKAVSLTASMKVGEGNGDVGASSKVGIGCIDHDTPASLN